MRRKNQVTGSTALARDQSGKRSGTPDQNLLLAPAWGLVSPAGRPALWQHSVDRVPLSCSVSPATFSQKPSLKAEKKPAPEVPGTRCPLSILPAGLEKLLPTLQFNECSW